MFSIEGPSESLHLHSLVPRATFKKMNLKPEDQNSSTHSRFKARAQRPIPLKTFGLARVSSGLNVQPEAGNSRPYTLGPKPRTLNKPQILSFNLSTPNLKPLPRVSRQLTSPYSVAMASGAVAGMPASQRWLGKDKSDSGLMPW